MKNKKINASEYEPVVPLDNGSRTTQIMKLVYSAVILIEKDRINKDDAIELLNKYADSCTPPYPTNLIIETISQAVDHYKSFPCSEESFILEGKESKEIVQESDSLSWIIATDFANSFAWAGKAAQSDRSVFLACCRLSKKHGDIFRTPLRSVTSLANIGSNHTAIVSLKNLETTGLIVYVGGKSGRTPALYKFSDTVLSHECDVSKFTEDFETPQMKDVFKKFGKVAYRCWKYLIQHPDSVTGTSKGTKQHISGVSRAIKTLLAHGMVTVDKEKIYYGNPVTSEKLERIAKVLGTLGYSDSHNNEHIKEKEIKFRRSYLTSMKEMWLKNWKKPS
jgi:hypothetical protein